MPPIKKTHFRRLMQIYNHLQNSVDVSLFRCPGNGTGWLPQIVEDHGDGNHNREHRQGHGIIPVNIRMTTGPVGNQDPMATALIRVLNHGRMTGVISAIRPASGHPPLHQLMNMNPHQILVQ